MPAWVGALALLGCPQLHDDLFGTSSAHPTGNLDSGGSGGLDPDAGGTEAEPDTEPAPDARAPDELGGLLVHRYRFEGSGGTVVDSVGNADGVTVGAVQNGGQVTLSGNNYVDLPNGIISSLESVTLEAWVTWSANAASSSSDWQILFSFGTNTNGEGVQGSGTTYLALTPKASNSGDIRASYTLTGYDDEVYADGEDYLPTSPRTQVAMVIDGVRGSLTIYVDGALADSRTGLRLDLSAIDDVNNWIGRSQFGVDPNFVGSVFDFRIYGEALSASQMARSHALGADADL